MPSGGRSNSVRQDGQSASERGSSQIEGILLRLILCATRKYRGKLKKSIVNFATMTSQHPLAVYLLDTRKKQSLFSGVTFFRICVEGLLVILLVVKIPRIFGRNIVLIFVTKQSGRLAEVAVSLHAFQMGFIDFRLAIDG